MNNTSNFTSFSSHANSCWRKPFALPLSDIKLISGKYLIPPVFIVGVIGNVLNLIVLNSNGMRTKTNSLLSAMAFADLCFFICILPSELVVFDAYQQSHDYMTFFIRSRMTLTALTNFFSTVSTWVAVLVTAERVVAIKMPLHAKFYWKRWRIVLTVVFIFVTSFLLTCYNFVWMKPYVVPVCNNTFYLYMLKPINETLSPNLHTYVRISLFISPFLVVVIPLILLIGLNSGLLYYLHKSRIEMRQDSYTNACQMKSNEHKVTLTVAIIVFSFIVSSLPSAILYLYDWSLSYVFNGQRSARFYTLATVTNLCVIVGKASNFVLYCSASGHFRRRLRHLVMCAECRRRLITSTNNKNRRRSSSMNSQRRTTLTSLFSLSHNNEQANADGNYGATWIAQQFRKLSMGKRRRSLNGNQTISSVGRFEMRQLFDPVRKRANSLSAENLADGGGGDGRRRFSLNNNNCGLDFDKYFVLANRRYSHATVAFTDKRNKRLVNLTYANELYR